MTYPDDLSPLDFDAQEQALLQQQARIKALRGVGAAPIETPAMSPGWTSAVTGTHVGGQTLKTPTAALLNPLIGNVGADYQEGRLNRATSNLNAAKQANAEGLVAGLGDSPTVNDFMKLQSNPLTRAVGQKAVEDRLIAAPIRASTERITLATQAAASREKALDRANATFNANIKANAPKQGSNLDSGLVAPNGAKIYQNSVSKEFMWAGMPSEGRTPSATAPEGATQDPNAQVGAPMPGFEPIEPAGVIPGAPRTAAGAVAQVESNGNPNAFNAVSGAKGAMQVLDATNGNPGYGVAPARDNSPAERERVGKDYLTAMQGKYGDSSGLIAYNWGPGNYEKWAAAGGKWADLPAETKEYIGKVALAKEGHSVYGAKPGAIPAGAVPAGGVAAPNAAIPPVNPRTSLPPGARPAPTAMSGEVQKEVKAAGDVMMQLQDLKNRLPDRATKGTADTIVGAITPNWAGKTGVMGSGQQDRSQFYSDFQQLSNTQLRAMSGLAVTESEMGRHTQTIPNKLSNDKAFETWIDRNTKLQEVAAVRAQAIAQDSKNKYLDPKLNAVVDRITGQIVPGTESPFTELNRKAGGVPNAAAATAPVPKTSGKWTIEPAN